MVKKQENNLLLSPKYDAVFHALFRKGNENITKALIQDITERKYKIIDMDKNVIMYDENVESKNEVLDLKVELDDGEICNLEIQLANKKNFKERMLDYWARLYSGQLKKGDDYTKLKRTILIAIVNFNIKEFINEEYHTKWKIREERNKELILTNDFEIHIIEIEKAIKSLEENKQDKIAQWMSFFDNPNSMEVKFMSEENKDINEALEQLRRLSSNKQLREIIEREERIERDRRAELQFAIEEGLEQGREKGIKEGIKEGIKKEKKNIINKFLEKGMKIEEISELLEMTKEEIENLLEC